MGPPGEVRLLAVADHAVTLLVVTPGPATLYTVAGPNEAVPTADLDPEVVKKLPGADAGRPGRRLPGLRLHRRRRARAVSGAVRMTR